MAKITYYLSLLVVGLTSLDAITIVEGVTYGRLSFILLIMASLFSGDIFRLKPVKYIQILFLFTLWAFLTTFWSFDVDETIMRILYLLQYLAIVIILNNVITTPKRFKNLCIAWIIGATYIAIRTVNDFLIYGYTSDSIYRVDEYGNPNENSFILCFAVVLMLILNRNNLKRLWIYTFLLFAFFVILANGSRTGLLMFLVIIIGLILTLMKNKKSMLLVVIPVFFTIAIYVFTTYIPEVTYTRFMDMKENLEEGNLAHREDIWKNAYNIFSNDRSIPLIGCGWGTFALVYQHYKGIYIGSHNFFINVIFTTGIIGFIIISCYFFRLIQYLRKVNKWDVLSGLLLVIPFISMLTTNWESRRWWFLLGVFVYKFSRLAEKKSNESY